jgi:osmotically-inducible protein OsmY
MRGEVWRGVYLYIKNFSNILLEINNDRKKIFMGWLQRLFGLEKSESAQVNPTSSEDDNTQTIDPERIGLNGEYDQSGLAKRVALAFDQDPDLDDIDTLWVAQTGGTVVLKGQVPSQEILNQMVAVAHAVNGTTDVDTTQVNTN